MRWKKLGRIFRAEGQTSWMCSHTAMPMPLHLEQDCFRVYFATRDAKNRAHICFVKIDLTNPTRVLEIGKHCVLGPGPWGFFDDSGVYPGSIVPVQGKLWMYYAGRNNGERPLYYMSIGLAESDDGGLTFRRLSDAPVLGRSKYDPWMTSTPWVRKEENLWRMWYLSGMGWKSVGDHTTSLYHIKYAESDDGIHWRPNNVVAVPLKEGETNVAAPTVLREQGRFKMWYSYVAGAGYRIGYAESEDGIQWWRRDEEVGVGLSEEGWDSDSMCYPNVFVHADRKYMLYSGNTFGREGIGIAVEADE